MTKFTAKTVMALLKQAKTAFERQTYLRNAEREYAPIYVLATSEITHEQGCEAFKGFRQTFPDYDPANLDELCAEVKASDSRSKRDTARFENFTEQAQDAAARVYEIMERYGHNHADTPHFLLALIEQRKGVIPQIFAKLDVDMNIMASRIDKILLAIPKAAIVEQVFITPYMKRIVDRSNDESIRFSDEYVSTEHIFLAIASESNTTVAKLLAENGITWESVMREIKHLRKNE